MPQAVHGKKGHIAQLAFVRFVRRVVRFDVAHQLMFLEFLGLHYEMVKW